MYMYMYIPYFPFHINFTHSLAMFCVQENEHSAHTQAGIKAQQGYKFLDMTTRDNHVYTLYMYIHAGKQVFEVVFHS